MAKKEKPAKGEPWAGKVSAKNVNLIVLRNLRRNRRNEAMLWLLR